MQQSFTDLPKDSMISRRSEWAEAHAYAAMIQDAPGDLRDRWGLSVRREGDCISLCAHGFPKALVLNRTFGFGVESVADEGTLERIEAGYLSLGVRSFAIELSSLVLTKNVNELLLNRGYVPFTRTVLMTRRPEISEEPADGALTALSVRRARREESADWAAVCCEVFRFGGPMEELLNATFANEAWRHWIALVEGQTAGAAVSHSLNGVTWIGWVCTLPQYRGRGVQTALTRIQLDDAYRSGAEWVTLEAVGGSVGRPAQSLRNYGRAGFQTSHERVAYLRRVTERANSAA